MPILKDINTIIGVGAADINKLKATGYYTIAVELQLSPDTEPGSEFLHICMLICSFMWFTVMPISNKKKFSKDQRLQ